MYLSVSSFSSMVPLLALLATVVGSTVTAVWVLSNKINKVQTDLTKQLNFIEVRLAEMGGRVTVQLEMQKEKDHEHTEQIRSAEQKAIQNSGRIDQVNQQIFQIRNGVASQ